MKRRLFLTGPIGCGKSTAILSAIGDTLPAFGGFLTRRNREEGLSFTLESPDGSKKETFLDFPSGQPRLNTAVFDGLGRELLTGDFLLLDEIGGVELLCPKFMAALEAVLKSDIPILGVIKGEGPASALIRHLELAEAYETAAHALRTYLREDENTLLYECKQYDEYAQLLAENWVKEYAK